MDDDNIPDIPGGFGKSYRKEFQSEVWLMPPLYHRVWYWVRMNVQYERFLFPTRKRFGIWVLPGQKLTSLQEIAEAVKWTEWGSEKVPNKKTITGIIHWLESREMVTVESNGKGTLITVINWHSYNKRKDEKVTTESNAVYPRVGHKEEGKEVKKESKTFSPSSDEVDGQAVAFYLTKKKKKLSGKRLDSFNEFWTAFDYRMGKAEAADAWLEIPTLTTQIVEQIIIAAKSEAQRRPTLRKENKTPKMAQGWINGRRWEDEPTAFAKPITPISTETDHVAELRAKGIDLQ